MPTFVQNILFHLEMFTREVLTIKRQHQNSGWHLQNKSMRNEITLMGWLRKIGEWEWEWEWEWKWERDVLLLGTWDRVPWSVRRYWRIHCFPYIVANFITHAPASIQFTITCIAERHVNDSQLRAPPPELTSAPEVQRRTNSSSLHPPAANLRNFRVFCSCIPYELLQGSLTQINIENKEVFLKN